MSEGVKTSRPLPSSPGKEDSREFKARRVTKRDPALLLSHAAHEGDGNSSLVLTTSKNLVVL